MVSLMNTYKTSSSICVEADAFEFRLNERIVTKCILHS